MPERISPTDNDWWPEYGWEHLQRYTFAAQFCHAGVGLDFGCGIGYGAEILARAGASEIAGVDVDANIIAAARLRQHPNNVSFHENLASASASFAAGFDFAVMFEVIEHVPDPTTVLHDLAARMKPGAPLLVSAPNKLQFTGAAQPVENTWHINEPTYSDLHAWLAADFVVTAEYEQSELRTEGQDYLIATLQLSWLLRLERGLRRLIRRPLLISRRLDALVHKTEIFPLIFERRTLCRQFLFVARKR
jgi:2-polyprenyl-3-methyl-5-hydroxy-6-metoxy-1,4-benzoquinol methylase